MQGPLVSVVIPCFNQARFLGHAIESVLHQSYRHFEIVVVDDGSRDNTEEVARRYEGVRYVYQENRGLPAARNAGTRASRGEYLVYLDADDLLKPNALETGLRYFALNPECAFVSGSYGRVAEDLTPLFKYQCRNVEKDHYLKLLQGNYIGMHATVMYRREILDTVGGFNEDLKACEDYEHYLRVARNHPVLSHAEVVADYRQHDTSMSRNPKFMLDWVLRVHKAEYPYVKGDPARETAYAEGERHLREYYGDEILAHLRSRFRGGAADFSAWRNLAVALWNYPVASTTRTRIFRKAGYFLESGMQRIKSKLLRPQLGKASLGVFSALHAIGETRTGAGSIVSWYEQCFLDQNRQDIQGKVVKVEGAGCPLSRLYELPAAQSDCVVCSMQLQRACDVPSAIAELGRILKSSGVLLASLPGVLIPADPCDDSDFLRFTAISAQRLFESHFGASDLRVSAFGNVLTAAGSLHGVPASAFSDEEMALRDEQFPFLITVRAVKA